MDLLSRLLASGTNFFLLFDNVVHVHKWYLFIFPAVRIHFTIVLYLISCYITPLSV